MAQPRILIVTTIESAFGGSEHLWFETALLLLERNWYVAIYFPYYKTFPGLAKLVSLGAHIFYGSPTPRRFLIRIKDQILGFKYNFENCVKASRPEITLISMGNHLEDSGFIRSFPKVPRPYIILPQLAMLLCPSIEIREYTRILFENAALTVCVSEENKQLIEVDLGIDLSSALVVGNSFRREEPLEWPETTTYNLAVPARLFFLQKGHDVILRVMRGPKWKSRNLFINFYGDGDSCMAIKNYLIRHQIKNITLSPFASIQEIWGKNHALLLTSRFEGMSLAMLEAMWLQRPVFVTKVGGVGEVVEDGVNGFVCESATVESVDHLLERSWAVRDQWKEMGLMAADRLKKLFPQPVEYRLADLIQQTRDLVKTTK